MKLIHASSLLIVLHPMTVPMKTSSAQSGRKTCTGQSRRWGSPNLQGCKRHLCMWHWTECDTAVLKRKKKLNLVLFYLWHIIMFCKRVTSGFINGRMEAFYNYLFLHCNFHTVFSIKSTSLIFFKEWIWVNHVKPFLNKQSLQWGGL